MSATPAISFLVCTRNRAAVARDCVLHLLATSRQDIEVVVRDNCSTDNTVALLRTINDTRLRIHVAPENQGTQSFFEISKLAKGNIVTWLSDEDNFQFDMLDYIIDLFKNNQTCDVVFGSILVGATSRRVMFADESISNPVRAYITALSFSGCGGLFVRQSRLMAANSYTVRNADDAYTLWNYYPVGFFASRCLTKSILTTTSRTAVVQTRFASTTNNWSATDQHRRTRLPHYYPESVVDRLVGNLASLRFASLPIRAKLSVARQLLLIFRQQARNFSNNAMFELLTENYSAEIVQAYRLHLQSLGVDRPLMTNLWIFRKIVVLPYAVSVTVRKIRRLSRQFS